MQLFFLLVPAAIVAIVVTVIHDLVRRPTLRRLAVRNIARRKSEAALVILGSLVATAIITAAFVMGGTFSQSIRHFAAKGLGPADEVVRVKGPDALAAVEQRLTGQPIPGTDGTLSMLTGGVAVSTPEPDVRAEPFASIIEVDFDAVRRFGPDVDITGFADLGATPTGNEIVVGEPLADEIEVSEGDTVVLHAYGQQRTFTVRTVAEERGIAGFSSPSVFVPPGTLASLTTAPGAVVAAPPAGLLLVSNVGGVYDSVERSDEVVKALEERLDGLAGVEVRAQKHDLLEEADDAAAELTSLFGFFGSFSVIVGILLLVNIFVMLAEERKTELGMLRAVGLKRNQLVRAFGIEGAIYSIVSAVVGAIVGIGVGRVMVIVASGIVSQEDGPFGLDLQFSAPPGRVITGLLIGAVISLLTVWGASMRIGRLNVIRAIRDLPEPTLTRHRLRTLVLSAAGVVIGGFLFLGGVGGDSWFGALAGLPIAAFSAIPLLTRITSPRVAVSALSAFALFWGVAVFNILPEAMEAVDIPAFVVQGIILVGAAVAILTVNNAIAVSAVDRLSGSARTLAARLGFAYPLARRFRTGILLGMYALVVFTLTLMAVFINLFQRQAPRLVEETRAGYDVLVDSNYGSPVPRPVLEGQPEVEAVSPLWQGFPEWTARTSSERRGFPISAFESSFLDRGVPKLAARDDRFADDRAAWQAVLADPSLLIVSDFFLQQGGGPPEAVYDVGEKVTLFNRLGGESKELTIAAKVESDWVFNGAFVGADFARSFLGTDVVPSRYYVKVKGDPHEVAPVLEGRLLRFGAKADTFEGLVREQLREQAGFIGLVQGYIALGLVIGIAGLGVVMVRAVRERRRQIGMLRAMGFPSRIVRSAFLIEAGFIALQGILIGIGLAILVSYQLMSNSDTFGDQRLDFSVPWLTLAALLVITLTFSLIATVRPAVRASRIKPAVALRIAD